VGVGRGGQAQRVGTQVAAGGGVVVALLVVVQAGLRVCVRRVSAAGWWWRSGARGWPPQGVLLVADQGAVRDGELGRGPMRSRQGVTLRGVYQPISRS
jgi:hypothetical protein